MIHFNPVIVGYELHEGYTPNTYAVLENTDTQFLICHVEKIFWKFYKQTEREFKTWTSCIGEASYEMFLV